MSTIYSPNNLISVSEDLASNFVHSVLNAQATSDPDHTLSETVALSIIWQGNKLGAAYYEFDTEHLYLMSDHSETAPAFTLLKLLLMQIEPEFIITSCKTDQRVIDILNAACKRRTSSGHVSGGSGSQNIHLLPHLDFVYESCRYRLQNLDLPNVPPNMSDAERRIFFASLIDFRSACMVKAAGGLLKFVPKKNLTECLSILDISSFSIKNIVSVSENTYRDLQIFQNERHPSVYKSSSTIKEGLSLYGICNKCKSSIGKKELKRWFLMPTKDAAIIEERHRAINFFNLSRNLEMVNALQTSLKHIKYLPKIFVRMKTAQASMNDWKTLYQTSYHAMMIGEICKSSASCLKIFSEISDSFSSDLFRVASLLDKVIDFPEYARQNHFAVKTGVDSDLDKTTRKFFAPEEGSCVLLKQLIDIYGVFMKRLYNGLPDFMTQVAQQELQELPPDIQKCSVIYLPQLGYLLTAPMTETMKQTKDYSLCNFRFMFVLGDTIHYKTDRTRKLDSLLGDTLCEIYDKETQIMHKLQNRILKMKTVYFSVMELLPKLDCLISLAVTAKEFNWIQPQMVNNCIFEVQKSRHPLQELCVASFVPNDIYSGGSDSRMKILTGPNSSGKSTYLKQVALIAFLAHIGSFVPAQQAKIPWLDAILSCIENVESISISLSSFLISLNQLSVCLKDSSIDSLVVIDEFGKNTEKASGLALLASAVNFWLEQGPSSPHLLVATHYLSIINYIPGSFFLSFQTMDMVMNEGELVLFYELVEGIAKSSYATNTALQAGLPKRIVERSIQIMKDVKENRPISTKDCSFVNSKLTKYFSIYNAFVELNVESDAAIASFMKWVKEFSKH